MSFNVLAGLIVCNLIWALNPVMGKEVLRDFSPAQSAWLRFVSALLGYVVLVPLVRSKYARSLRRQKIGHSVGAAFLLPKKSSDWIFLFGLGFMAFFFAPMTQTLGLSTSFAAENSLIVAMEPLLTVFLAWVVLGESLSLLASGVFLLALFGFCLLAGLIPLRHEFHWEGHLKGNIIILISLLGEACYSIFARKLVDRHAATGVFGSALAIGVMFLTLALAFLTGGAGFSISSHLTASSAVGLFWLGPLGTTATYLFWMIALQGASIASLCLTLFIQPVIGAGFGYVMMGDRLSPSQGLGALLILIAVFAFSWNEYRQKRSPALMHGA